MKTNKRSSNGLMRVVTGAGFLVLALGLALPAFAQSNLLFQGVVSRLEGLYSPGQSTGTMTSMAQPQRGLFQNVGSIPTPAIGLSVTPTYQYYPGPNPTPTVGDFFGTLQLNPLGGGGTARSFTIPSKAFKKTVHFTLTAPGFGYPLLIADAYRYNKAAGPFYDSAEVPGTAGIRTALPTSTQYPANTSTPPVAQVIVRPGPNGFGGPMPIVQRSAYYGVRSNTAGNFDFIFLFAGPPATFTDPRITLPTTGGGQNTFMGTWGSLPTQNKTAGLSFGTNTATSGIKSGAVAKHHPAVWAVTGTLTASEPGGFAATLNIKTGMDNRNTAGTSGTIQLVSSRIFSSYVVTPTPPPFDGTATPGQFRFGTARIYKTGLQMAPEPGSIALVAVGVMGIVGLRRLRRR